jgi:hypothetical protein
MSRTTPENFDKQYFDRELAPYLPDKILDFHTHIWRPEQWYGYKPDIENSMNDNSEIGDPDKLDNQKYMTSRISYTAEELLADGGSAFPGLTYSAVAFGQPTPKVDNKMTNAYVRESAVKSDRIFPLRVTGQSLPTPGDMLRREMETDGWYGYKVYLDWHGDEYPPFLVEDMLSSDQLALADEKGLIILLHVPRRDRLADPEVGKSVRDAALRYPRAKFVIAHCGRCYRYEEIRLALHWVADLDNV